MLPRREEFFQEVRRAVRLEKQPKVNTDSDVLNEERISQALYGVALWLTPKLVEKYAPEDFEEWSEELQKQLSSAVSGFRAAAGEAPPAQAPTKDQFVRALAAFRELTAAVREVIVVEWTQAVEGLIRQAEGWVADNGWRARRVERKISETLLGTYLLPQLQVYADADLYVLEPVARFVPGAMGAYSLSIQPSYYVTTLYRQTDGRWYAHLDVGQGAAGGRRELWSPETFRASLEELRSVV
jgi:hypothetical protein